MDISLFSVVMAFITSSILIILIHLFTRNKKLDKHLGVSSIIILYICSVFRLCIPLEFPNNVIILNDSVVYPFFSDFLFSPIIDTRANKYEPVTGLRIIDLLAIILAAVTIVLLIRQAHKYYHFTKVVGSYTNIATDREKRIFEKTLTQTGLRRKVKLIVIDENITPMTYGVLRPVVLMPCNDYNDEELEFVFRHELTHQKNNDILVKLLVAIYCSVFWWNPFVYLLNHDLAQKLEIKCDYRTTQDNTADEKLVYLNTIIKCIKNNSKAEINKNLKTKCSLISAEFVVETDSGFTKERFEYILDLDERKHFGKIVNIILAFSCAAILAASYMFIWQPSTGGVMPVEAYQDGDPNCVISDASNSYLIKQPDGSYIFYFMDQKSHISKEEYEQGLYDSYQIIE